MFDFWIMQRAGQNVASCRNTSSGGTICRGVDGTARGSKTEDRFLRIKREDAGAAGTQPARPPGRIVRNGEIKCRQNMAGKIRATRLQTQSEAFHEDGVRWERSGRLLL